MTSEKKAVANSMVVLREEFDDCGVLFDPDTAKAFGLNPISVFVWNHLDGKHSIKDIVDKIRENFEDVPEKVEKDVAEYVQQLVDQGVAGYAA